MAWRLAKCLEVLRAQINALSPNRSKASDGTIGDAAHSSRASDHNPNDAGVVCAVDLTHDPAHGIDSHKLAEKLLACRDERIKYIISNGKIASSTRVGKTAAWEWRPYTGKNPHNHHVHISASADKRLYDSTKPWQIDMRAPAAASKPAKVDPPVLVQGNSGPEVKALQGRLNKNGASLNVDGEFGVATLRAVKAFQKSKGIVADGAVGSHTRELLGA